MASISDVDFADGVAAAVLAPSLHNSQPWRFRRHTAAADVCVDRDRVLPSSDPTGWAARVACGAAALNMRLAFAVRGHPVDVQWQPDGPDSDVMARMTPAGERAATPVELNLYRAIPRRHSNRRPFWPQPVPIEARAQIVDAVHADECWLELLTDAGAVAAVAEIANAAQQTLSRDANYVAELTAWTRVDEAAHDGVPAGAGGPSAEPQDLLPQRGFGDRHRAPGRDFEPSPLIAVLGSPGDLSTDQLRTGYGLQRVLLTVTDLGLAASMLSQPIEVPAARERLRQQLGRFGVPQMVLRIGYGEPGPATRRRPLGEVMVPR